MKSSQVFGMKEITAPSASLAIGSKPFILLKCESDDLLMSEDSLEEEHFEASPSIFNKDVTALVSNLPEIKV